MCRIPSHGSHGAKAVDSSYSPPLKKRLVRAFMSDLLKVTPLHRSRTSAGTLVPWLAAWEPLSVRDAFTPLRCVRYVWDTGHIGVWELLSDAPFGVSTLPFQHSLRSHRRNPCQPLEDHARCSFCFASAENPAAPAHDEPTLSTYEVSLSSLTPYSPSPSIPCPLQFLFQVSLSSHIQLHEQNHTPQPTSACC